MDDSSKDILVVARGNWGRVEYAVRKDGSVPARDYVHSLKDIEAAKVLALFQWMADTGRIYNREKFKQVDGELFEFKAHQVRISCWRKDNCWYLLDGFIKKQDNWKPGELSHALNLLAEHKQLMARR